MTSESHHNRLLSQTGLAVFAIVLAAAGRVVGLAWSVDAADRLSAADRLAAASSIQRHVFDADAAVLLVPGDDGLPGQAGRDDDFDGVIDNQSEMGAVGSDDLCLAPWNHGYQVALQSGQAVVISRGTFVGDGYTSPKQAASFQADAATRLLIQGRDGDQAWSRMMIGPAE
jgi:hypothetical protein